MIKAILPLADASGMVAGMTDAIAIPPEALHTPRPKPVLGVSVCVWRDGKVLLIERGNPPAKGLWAPVGGRVEWGETLQAAARREVHEEAAIACDIVGFSQLREMIEPENGAASGHHVVLAVFAATWVSGEIAAGDDASAVAWVDPAALGEYALVPGVIPYIEATRRLIEDMA